MFPCTSNTRNILGAAVSAVTVSIRPETSIRTPRCTFPANRASVEELGTTAELLDRIQPCELLERFQPPEEDLGRTELEDKAASLETAWTLLDSLDSELLDDSITAALLELRTNSQSETVTPDLVAKQTLSFFSVMLYRWISFVAPPHETNGPYSVTFCDPGNASSFRLLPPPQEFMKPSS